MLSSHVIIKISNTRGCNTTKHNISLSRAHERGINTNNTYNLPETLRLLSLLRPPRRLQTCNTLDALHIWSSFCRFFFNCRIVKLFVFMIQYCRNLTTSIDNLLFIDSYFQMEPNRLERLVGSYRNQYVLHSGYSRIRKI